MSKEVTKGRPYIVTVRLPIYDHALHTLWYCDNEPELIDGPILNRKNQILFTRDRKNIEQLFDHAKPFYRKFGPPHRRVNQLYDFAVAFKEIFSKRHLYSSDSNILHTLIFLMDALDTLEANEFTRRCVGTIFGHLFQESSFAEFEAKTEFTELDAWQSLHAAVGLVVLRSVVV